MIRRSSTLLSVILACTVALAMVGVQATRPAPAAASTYYVTDSMTLSTPCPIVTATPDSCLKWVIIPGKGNGIIWIEGVKIQQFVSGVPVGSVLEMSATAAVGSTGENAYCLTPTSGELCARMPHFSQLSPIWQNLGYKVVGLNVQTPAGASYATLGLPSGQHRQPGYIADGYDAAEVAAYAQYPQETESLVPIILSAEGRGCYGTITVTFTKTVMVWCVLTASDQSYTFTKTNYKHYGCTITTGCTYHFWIEGQPGFFSSMVMVTKSDDLSGLHALVMEVGSAMDDPYIP